VPDPNENLLELIHNQIKTSIELCTLTRKTIAQFENLINLGRESIIHSRKQIERINY
jgi:hypothetical protein